MSISSTTSEAESDSDTSSSSGSFFDITSSESEPEHSFSVPKVQGEEQGPPSQSPSSNASSKSEGKKTLEKSKNNATMLAETEYHEAHDLMASMTGKFKEDERPHPKPPYKGKIQTQMRNRRRRLTKKIQRLKSMGNLSPNAVLMKVTELKRNEGKSKSEQCGRNENLQDSVTGSDNTLQAKKKSLLQAIDSNEPEHLEDLGKDGYVVDQNYSELSTPAHVTDLEPTDQLFVDQGFREREAVEPNLSDTIQSRKAVGVSSPADNTPPELDAPESTKRRSKLDISSSRRLLFGSLGLRAPKNKDDELKIKEKLMKGVKPLTDFRSSRAGENGESCAFDPAEGDEKWREKVVFKAVECCHDNIKLSTPPFPFVQRWDPQQQYPFPKTTRKGKKSFRRKKRSQVSKSKMNDTPWQESVSLEVESFPNDCSFDQPLDGQEQATFYGESDDYRTAIKEQLMRETDASLGASGEAEIAQDLPHLPGDMSICPLLTAETALPGAIVAFKQLDMSEFTNWQPKMSEYRTARVDCVTDEGTLQMRLAKRDLMEKEDRYDEYTGERIYSKFEMPGFDDEESQARNVIEISFSELIEPRLIHATDVDLSRDENQQYSSLRGGDSPPSANIAIEDGVGSSSMNVMVPSPTNPSVNSVDIHATEGANEEVRQEIFDLIKDAGWRSSIRSNNGEENGAERNILPFQEQMNGVNKRNGGSVSSKFSGFGSSPPIIRSTPETGVRYDRPGGHTADSTMSSPHKSDLEIAESLPAQPIPTSESPLRNPPNNDDGEKEMKEEDTDHGIIQEIAWNKSQHGSDGMEVDHQILSQELPSETSLCQSVSYTVGSEAPNFHHSSGVPPEDTSSDNEFPSLENVFSQIRSSQPRSSFEPSLLADEDTSYVDQSSYGSTLSRSGMTRKRSSQKVESDGQDDVSQKQPLFEWVDSDAQEDQSTPRASQMPLQSQIVDLTLSSDAVDQADVADPLDDSDYVDDGTQLPGGPGWVKKTRASIGQRDAGYSRASRSRSTGVF